MGQAKQLQGLNIYLVAGALEACPDYSNSYGYSG
jgi:hypothetical protein